MGDDTEPFPEPWRPVANAAAQEILDILLAWREKKKGGSAAPKLRLGHLVKTFDECIRQNEYFHAWGEEFIVSPLEAVNEGRQVTPESIEPIIYAIEKFSFCMQEKKKALFLRWHYLMEGKLQPNSIQWAAKRILRKERAWRASKPSHVWHYIGPQFDQYDLWTLGAQYRDEARELEDWMRRSEKHLNEPAEVVEKLREIAGEARIVENTASPGPLVESDLSPDDKLIAEAIREIPGINGPKISIWLRKKGIDKSSAIIRKRLMTGTNLFKLGYRQKEGVQGYFPPRSNT
jgi:hypothetical protein